jgi:hypothetical protein
VRFEDTSQTHDWVAFRTMDHQSLSEGVITGFGAPPRYFLRLKLWSIGIRLIGKRKSERMGRIEIRNSLKSELTLHAATINTNIKS